MSFVKKACIGFIVISQVKVPTRRKLNFLTILCYVRDFYRQANQELQITNGYSSKSKRENSYLNPMNV